MRSANATDEAAVYALTAALSEREQVNANFQLATGPREGDEARPVTAFVAECSKQARSPLACND